MVRTVVLSSCALSMVVALASADVVVDPTQVGHPSVPRVTVQGVQSVPVAHAFAPLVVLDDFNRADGPLGANWAVQAGTFGIVSNTARATSELSLATFVGKTATAVEADVDASGETNLDYVALVLDYADLNNSLFLKVQGSGGTFGSAACYTGNNGPSFGLGFFSLSLPFTTAHMRVERVGTTVTMTFSNIDGGSGTQTYTCTGAPATGGLGIGMGGYGYGASLDNFAAEASAISAIPAAGSVGLLLLVLALLGTGFVWLVRRA